jgi:hypothetical protein
VTSWTPPEVDVVFVRREGGTTFVGLRLGDARTAPLAPASLVASEQVVLDLDAVVTVETGVTTFRTRSAPPTNLVGEVVGFQQWWDTRRLRCRSRHQSAMVT